MLIDTEKDSGVWIEFIDQDDERSIGVSWHDLGTGKSSARDDLISAIACVMVTYMKQGEWKPNEVCYFYSRIMHIVADMLLQGPNLNARP